MIAGRLRRSEAHATSREGGREAAFLPGHRPGGQDQVQGDHQHQQPPQGLR